MNKELLEIIKDKGKIQSFQKGISLLSVGSVLDSFILVLEGEIKVYLSGPDGKRKTLYWINTHECCLLGVSCLLASTSYPAYAQTTKDSKVLMVSKSDFDNFMRFEKFRNLIFSMQSQRLTETLELLMLNSFRDLDFRLARYLIKKSQYNKLVQVTHQEASEDLGASRERVSKSFKALESNDHIERRENGLYWVNKLKIELDFTM